jgi:hypothetical protein
MLITGAHCCWVLTCILLPTSYHAFQMQGKPKGHFSTLLHSLSNVISVPFFPLLRGLCFLPFEPVILALGA